MLKISLEDLHAHLQSRMNQRGVTLPELEQTLSEGWEAKDCKPGTLGKVMVFAYEMEWEGQSHLEKEVTVYYKEAEGKRVLLTVKARYGASFPRS